MSPGSRYWSTGLGVLEPYTPGEQTADRSSIKLNTNESPFPPSPRVSTALSEAAFRDLRLYPDPRSRDLRECIAKYHGVPSDGVFVGNGSDEVLAHAFRAFFSGRTVLVPDVTYSFYGALFQLLDVKSIRVPVDQEFRVVPDTFTREGPILVAHPNAPTGMSLQQRELGQLATLADRADGILLVDEAYVDFGAISALPLLPSHPNVLIVRTVSKSRGLAGARLGYALGDPALVDGLTRVKDSFNSYPINSLTSRVVLASFQDEPYFNECCRRTIEIRDWFSNELKALGFEVLPSQANFVFASPPSGDAGELQAQLRQYGILLRHFAQPRTRAFLRISIGTRDQMSACLSALRACLAPQR